MAGQSSITVKITLSVMANDPLDAAGVVQQILKESETAKQKVFLLSVDKVERSAR